MHTHHAASHGIANFSLHGRSRWLLFYNPVFSAAQRTILAILSKGACLCLASRDKLATSLPEVVRDMQVDALGLTPSALSLLSPASISPCLKQVTTVGEPMSQEVVDAWAEKVDLFVSYGLSECAQLNFAKQISKGENPRIVGSPRDTTQAFVFKPNGLIEQQEGLPGELCLEGPQVARGYYGILGDATFSFLEKGPGGQNFYRTGDRAVRHSDGTYEILGRLDDQIKINGQRIEPGEVNTVLARTSGVATLAVVGVEIKERASLLAVVVLEKSERWSNTVGALRQQAQESLPPYMVPSYWMQMEMLPTNANGKVDIAKIRQLAQQTNVEKLLGELPDVEVVSDQPWTEIQLLIQRIWARVLQLELPIITRSSSFIALGGTSLDAIQVVRELRSQGFLTELGDILRTKRLIDLNVRPLNSIGGVPSQDTQPFKLSLVEDAETRELLEKDMGVVDAYPPTPFQSSLLASTLQGSSAYLYQRSFDVRHMDLVKLRLAFQVAFSASDVLRTTFTHSRAGILQVVRNDFPLPWSESSESVRSFQSKDQNEGFAFDKPFIRFTVLQRQILIVSTHHSMFDFWSHRFLYEDVSCLYLGIQQIKRPSFRDFVYYLRHMDSGPAKTFWRSYLGRSEPSILNRSPSAKSTQRSRYIQVHYKPMIKALGVTLGAFVYTAWAILLARHTGHNDVVFATTIAGRDVPIDHINLLDGPTMSVVPQAISLDPRSSIARAVQATHDSFWDVLKHSQYGMRDSLIASNQQDRQLFDTLVNILVQEDGGERFSDRIFQVYGPKPRWQTEWTSLDVEEEKDGCLFRISSKMSEQRADFILEQLSTILDSMVNDYNASIGSIDVLGEEERRWLIGSPAVSWTTVETLHGRFEAMVEKYPDRTALQWQMEAAYTYRELDVMSDQMAFFLTKNGIKYGDIVPVLLEKSPIMIIAILAVLKIGAAYVPLSHNNPVDRNLFIVHEAKARLVLTESAHENYFTTQTIALLLLDGIDLSKLPIGTFKSQVSPDQLAYIIYTSGSTGQPKGVMIKHRSAAAAISSMIAFEGRENRAFKTLQFSNYVFDASLYDIFVPLGSGHTLCMSPTDRLLSELATVINEMEVSHCFLTPTVTRLLDPKSVPSLKVLTVGGEPVTPDVVETWSEGHTLINAYGPTETSIMVTMRFLSPHANPKVIGKPFPTTKAFIVEPSSLRLLPWGAIGELCFCGPQVGEGYLGRPQQTAAVFFENGIEGSSRVYRTGDLGRWLPNGELECLGRKDNQIKINGHRIELGEIEQAMKKSAFVKDVVVVLDDQKSKPQLVAFVVFPWGDSQVSSSLQADPDKLDDLRDSMKGLAHYMMPKFVIPINQLPTLPSGKTNRKELKAAAGSLDAIELSKYSLDPWTTRNIVKPPETHRQRVLQQVWARLLSIDTQQFGLEANFLTLGGDSIGAINLVSHLRGLGFMISVGEVLSSSTLEDMAACMESQDQVEVLEQQTSDSSDQAEEAFEFHGLHRAEYECIYPCPPGQAEFLSQGAQEDQFWVVMITRKLPKMTEVDTWIHTAKQLAEANDILRTTFLSYQGKWFGAVLEDATPVVSFEDAPNAEARTEILERVWKRRFIAGQPFVRYTIIHTGDDDYEINIKMDHGLYDGTLLRIFDDHFKALQQGQPVPSFTSFQTFARHIDSSDKERSLKYWNEPDQRPSPFRYPEVENPMISAVHVLTTNLPVDSYAAKLAQTPAMIFQSAFQIWLAQRSGRKDISFDYLYTGRNVNLANPQSINGTCANFLPLRSNIDQEQSVKAYIATTNKTFWRATENGNVGLDDIYRACGLKREQVQNTALFLFQPFEPPPPPTTGDGRNRARWVVMAGSEVRMPQPYGVVVEVSRMREGYKIKFGYDGRTFDGASAKSAAADYEGVVRMMIKLEVGTTKMQTLLESAGE